MSGQERPVVITEVLGQLSDTVVVTAQLVWFLRNGLQCELGFAAEHVAKLMLEFEDQPPAEECCRAFENLEGARALFQEVNRNRDQPNMDIELDLSSNALIILKALEGQYNAEVDRLHETGFYGPSREILCDRVRALKALLLEVKLHVQRQGVSVAFGY